MTPERVALAALTLFAIVLTVAFAWHLTGDWRTARRVVRQLRTISSNPAMPIPTDTAVAAAGHLDLTDDQRATQEAVLECWFAAPSYSREG